MNAINIDYRAIREWLEGMGWRCHFLDGDHKAGLQCYVFHPIYGKGFLEFLDNGCVLVRPGGISGAYIFLGHELNYYSDGSFESVRDSPFPPALEIASALDCLDKYLPPPPLDCSEEVYQRYEKEHELALSGSMLWWSDKLDCIPNL